VKPTLAQFRECVRTNRYIVTTHAAEEMDDDGLTIFDVERIILAGQVVKGKRTGKRIIVTVRSRGILP
jgi:hypothetical protein